MFRICQFLKLVTLYGLKHQVLSMEAPISPNPCSYVHYSVQTLRKRVVHPFFVLGTS